MIRPAFALIAASAATLPASALTAAEIEIEASGPVVELNVFESVEVAPDVATIGAGVTTEAPTATEALRRNSAEMAKVVARIKALGVADKDIQTTGINLNAMYDYDQESGRQVFRGYQAGNRVSVMLRKIEDTGMVLDALVVAGANDISGPSFSLSDDTAAKDAARKRAFERAQTQAKAYAEMLGYDGAKVLAIAEDIQARGDAFDLVATQLAIAKAEAEPPVQPGMIEAVVNLTIKYELVNDVTAEAE